MFEQYLFTDNVQGKGLSVLSKSSGITKKLLNNLDEFTIYEAPISANPIQNPEVFTDACRYNRSFCASPMLMNIAYIGKEVTTGRNRNYVAHTLISNNKLNGYAVDYFLNKGLFKKFFLKSEVDGTTQSNAELPTIDDIGISPQGSMLNVINNINNDIEFYKQLLQSVVLSVENGFQIKMVNYDNPLQILQMIYYVFPVDLANLITFNTREYFQKSSTPKTLSIRYDGEEIFKTCYYGSVEVIQFYNQNWSKNGGDYKTIFVKNENYNKINKILGFISWLTKNNCVTAERIKVFKSFIEEKKIVTFKQLIEVDYFVLENYERNFSTRPKVVNIEKNTIKSETNTFKNDKKEVEIINKERKFGTINRKFKFSILNIFLILALVSAIVCISINLISKINFGDNGTVDSITYLVFEDGSKIKKNDFNLNELPTKTGYLFDGYIDENGLLVVDKNGMFNENYDFDKNDIKLKCSWIPMSYKFKVNNFNELSFECKTDDLIEIPNNFVDSLNYNVKPHTRFMGFALIENGDVIFNLTDENEYEIVNSYETLNIDMYQKLIKDNVIRLYPIYKTENMKFTFKDYYSNDVIDIIEIPFSESGVVPSASFYENNPNYNPAIDDKLINIYFYNESKGEKIIIGDQDGFNGTQNELTHSNYISGDVTLYIAIQVKVYIANNYKGVELGSNLFDLTDEYIKNINDKMLFNTLYYKFNNKDTWMQSDDSETIWSNMGKNLNVYLMPGITIKFNYNYYDVSKKEYKINDDFSSSYALKFDIVNGKYIISNYTNGNTIISDNICAEPLILNGFKIASNNGNSWIYENQLSSYTLLDNCILDKNKSSSTNVVISNKTINKDIIQKLFDYCKNKKVSVIDLYSVYKPENIMISFGDEINFIKKEIIFGEEIYEWKNELKEINNTPWGKKCTGWICGDKELLYDSSEDTLKINFDFFENINSNNEINFLQIYESYQFEIIFRIDDKVQTFTKEVGDEIDLSKWKIDGKTIEEYYNANYYNKQYVYHVGDFNAEWFINDTYNIELTNGILPINQEKLKDYVEFDNDIIEITFSKNIKYREYNILFDNNIYVKELTSYKVIENKLNRIDSKIYFKGEILTECQSITIESIYELQPKKYDFVGWMILSINGDNLVDKLLNDNKNLTMNDDFLQLLYENKMSIDENGIVFVKLAAIYQERNSYD